MKKRISVTLSTDVWAEIDLQIGAHGSRSAFIEKVLSSHFEKREREEIGARDLAIINANADYLNQEAEDVLQHQAEMFYEVKNRAKSQ
ncbi:MAG: hypothetical protein ABSE46_05890 [Terracidiphilus sp.]|jgi:metal-responsive CopG/Arc/MetJ family transcriptional regulator